MTNLSDFLFKDVGAVYGELLNQFESVLRDSSLLGASNSSYVPGELNGVLRTLRNLSPIPKSVAKENVYSGVAELKRFGQHSSNAFMLGVGGYFLTSYHCVDDIRNLRVRIRSGKSYAVEKVLVRANNQDIALAKANIPDNAQPLEYRMHSPRRGDLVFALARWNGKLRKLPAKGYGSVSNSYASGTFCGGGQVKNQVETSIIAQPGYSGGVLLTPDYKVVGFVNSIDTKSQRVLASRMNGSVEMINHYLAHQG